MAALSNTKRAKLWADLQRELSNERTPIPFDKQTGRDIVNAIDDWFSDNSPSLIAAMNAAGATGGPKFKLRFALAVLNIRHGDL